MQAEVQGSGHTVQTLREAAGAAHPPLCRSPPFAETDTERRERPPAGPPVCRCLSKDVACLHTRGLPARAPRASSPRILWQTEGRLARRPDPMCQDAAKRPVTLAMTDF